jgi:3-oxoacyl-[acyl-carrier protein] reductase
MASETSQGDVAIVTGGAGYIGSAIARRLQADGFRVVTVDLRPADHAASERHLILDLTDAAAVREALGGLASREPVTRLVNNAGIVRPASLVGTTLDDLRDVLAVNLEATIVTTQAVLPAMQRLRRGRIVAIGSRAGLGKELRTAYAASKAGLVGLAKTWALELGDHGITANVVAPGPIRTALFDAANPPGDPRTTRIVEAIPVGRMGTPEDVAAAVGFLCSDDAGFVTGQVLYVCGGMTVGASG